MIAFKAFLFVMIMVRVTKSDVEFETLCKKNHYTDLNNTQMDVLKYCSNKLCIEKCCDEDEMLSSNDTCMSKTAVFNQILSGKRPDLEAKVNYSNNILSFPSEEKLLKKNFVLFRNHRDVSKCTEQYFDYVEYSILEDGTFQMQLMGSKDWYEFKRLNYCIEFKLIFNKTAEIPNEYKVQIVFRPYTVDPEDDQSIRVFELIAMPVSSFFLLLVLVVYCLLPDLQNLIGKVLMAFVTTLLLTFIMKWIIDFYFTAKVRRLLSLDFCEKISPFMYFGALSCFFWFNVMSYDVWQGLRSHRKRRDINPRGERVKFMWYCLYAWGSPLLMTVMATILHFIDLTDTNIVQPPFDCLNSEGQGYIYYFQIPIGILIVINTVLFILTVYNIWMVKRAVLKCKDDRSSAAQTNSFSTYVKLSVIMGVNWCLELLPPNSTLWVYVLTNLYNILIGVAIFFLFVCKKQIFIKLCKKFNILKDFTNKLELSQQDSSRKAKTTKNSSSDKNQEMDLIHNNHTGENSGV